MTITTPKTTRSSEARERLIETADRLFYEAGIHSTGIDRVIAEANIAKATLYSNFSSKDELVLATLERRDRIFSDLLEERFSGEDFSPREKIMKVMNIVTERMMSPVNRGCPLMNAATEYCDPAHPVREYVRNSRQNMFELFHSLATEANLRTPKLVAERLCQIVYGTVAWTIMTGNHDCAHNLPAFAELILNDAAQSGG